jgi:hypothetical protein
VADGVPSSRRPTSPLSRVFTKGKSASAAIIKAIKRVEGKRINHFTQVLTANEVARTQFSQEWDLTIPFSTYRRRAFPPIQWNIPKDYQRST